MSLVARYNSEVTALCRRFGVCRLEQDDPSGSDVDFLVEFETLPDNTCADAYFSPLESLEALLQRPVDLWSPRPSPTRVPSGRATCPVDG